MYEILYVSSKDLEYSETLNLYFSGTCIRQLIMHTFILMVTNFVLICILDVLTERFLHTYYNHN